MIRTLPGMIIEAFRTPAHYRAQEKDWIALERKIPGMAHYEVRYGAIEDQLRPAYQDYIQNISSPLISLSLNRAVFVATFIQTIAPRRILDLGSGFSTYVFGDYARQPGGDVLSIDHAEEWLDKTREFLEHHRISNVRYNTIDQLLSEYSSWSQVPFDLCLLDIGDFELRKQILPDLIESVVNCQSALLIDDYHVADYRRTIQSISSRYPVQLLSLRKFTRRRLSHMALVLPKSELSQSG